MKKRWLKVKDDFKRIKTSVWTESNLYFYPYSSGPNDSSAIRTNVAALISELLNASDVMNMIAHGNQNFLSVS